MCCVPGWHALCCVLFFAKPTRHWFHWHFCTGDWGRKCRRVGLGYCWAATHLFLPWVMVICFFRHARPKAHCRCLGGSSRLNTQTNSYFAAYPFARACRSEHRGCLPREAQSVAWEAIHTVEPEERARQAAHTNSPAHCCRRVLGRCNSSVLSLSVPQCRTADASGERGGCSGTRDVHYGRELGAAWALRAHSKHTRGTHWGGALWACTQGVHSRRSLVAHSARTWDTHLAHLGHGAPGPRQRAFLQQGRCLDTCLSKSVAEAH